MQSTFWYPFGADQITFNALPRLYLKGVVFLISVFTLALCESHKPKKSRDRFHNPHNTISFSKQKRSSMRFMFCWWRISFRSFMFRKKKSLPIADSSNISFSNNWIKLEGIIVNMFRETKESKKILLFEWAQGQKAENTH